MLRLYRQGHAQAARLLRHERSCQDSEQPAAARQAPTQESDSQGALVELCEMPNDVDEVAAAEKEEDEAAASEKHGEDLASPELMAAAQAAQQAVI